ncbi:MAG TPA: enoyl-CoA hydratase/isomerase family protein [Acidimicrobiia bacterium]
MGIVAADPRLLHTERPALDLALAELLDGPTCLVLGGAWPPAPAAADALRALPALTIGTGAVPPELADAFDLVVDDPGPVAAAFERAPLAAVSAALLLRHPPPTVPAGLVAESATYSMLQAGPEFAAWRSTFRAKPAADETAPRVRVEVHRRVTLIVLTRGDKHNALDRAMRDQLHAALNDARWSSGPVAIVADGPSFCSGGDLDEFATFPDPVQAHLVRLDRSLASACFALAERLVVGLHGACLGAGIELPAFAAHVVAADDARIGLPEQRLGLVPGAGGTVSITRRAGRQRTLSLLLRDGTITADEARAWGLVDDVVDRDRLRMRVLEIAESLS